MARPVSWMMIILSLLSLLLVSAFPGVAGADTSRFQRTSLANGLVILVAEDHSLPFVTMKLLVDGGSKNDPAGREGACPPHLAGDSHGHREEDGAPSSAGRSISWEPSLLPMQARTSPSSTSGFSGKILKRGSTSSLMSSPGPISRRRR